MPRAAVQNPPIDGTIRTTRIITIVAVEVPADIKVLSWRTNRLTEITANTQSMMNPAKNPAATA
jgi:hypothetical protein